MQKHAYFAAGCFWCITPVFIENGASQVVAGYMGGKEVNPTYEEVKAQKTGHRESIEITYEDSTISYQKLLEIYLQNVDPFDQDGQYIDRGHSYTLAIYYQDEEEKKIAQTLILDFEKQSQKKVAIALEPSSHFYPAEEYHQNYYQKHPKEFEEELIQSGRKK